jgi:hypothetical protein
MDNVYTCSCGNQTWVILDNAVRCAVCNEQFAVQLTPVRDFNRTVTTGVMETEEV